MTVHDIQSLMCTTAVCIAGIILVFYLVKD
jgi:hypothetical protein